VLDLPPSPPTGLCVCGEGLYYRAATATVPAGFRCKNCGAQYSGAKEWSGGLMGTLPGVGHKPPELAAAPASTVEPTAHRPTKRRR
jgi:hypothetical protein